MRHKPHLAGTGLDFRQVAQRRRDSVPVLQLRCVDRLDQAGGLDNTGKLTLIGTIVGAVGMILFPLLIGFTARVRHVLQLSLTAAVLAFVCVLCVGMTQPFTGMLRVEPEAFTTVTEELAGIPAEQSR